MKNIIRKLFQTFTFILFIIQFQQSVRKYFQYPIVEQTSRIPVKDLPIPVVYVCQTNQFNYSKAEDQGYNSFTYFMAGINVNDRNITWQGHYRNQTYNQLENMLLDSDYSSLNCWSKSKSTKQLTDCELKRTFLFPHGVCVELEKLQQQSTIAIFTKNEVSILFIDPARANTVRTEETIAAKTSIGPTSDIYFSHGMYKIEYVLYDECIHDGTTCTDYTRSDMSYGACLNNILTQKFMTTYGCLPPWVFTNNSEMICGKETIIDANAMKKTPLVEDLSKLMMNDETEMFKRCLPPCKTMHLKLSQIFFNTKSLHHAGFVASSKELATVYTQVYSYDILSLTVDLGSALGLWMGLSCLSILDFILENWISMKRYWKR